MMHVSSFKLQIYFNFHVSQKISISSFNISTLQNYKKDFNLKNGKFPLSNTKFNLPSVKPP